MGRTFLFECPRCHYRATVAGGADRGFNCFVQTIVCRECASLYDAVTRLRMVASQKRQFIGLRWRPLTQSAELDELPPSAAAWHNRLLFGGIGDSQWVTLKLRCPVSKKHHVEPWTEPGQCPQCGTYLERTVMPYRIWD